MKYQNIIFYSLIPLALLSIPSLLENVLAQTNSTSQTALQQNQNTNITAQALMKLDIFDLKNKLMDAKMAVVDENFEEGLTIVRDVETDLLLVKPTPTKFLNDLHKITNAIAKSDINKSLDTLTKVQVDTLKAENHIFKAAVVNPQLMQQFNNMEQAPEEEEEEEEEEY